jgi:hypothetical protein
MKEYPMHYSHTAVGKLGISDKPLDVSSPRMFQNELLRAENMGMKFRVP